MPGEIHCSGRREFSLGLFTLSSVEMFTIADVMSKASQLCFANSAAVLCDLGGQKLLNAEFAKRSAKDAKKTLSRL
jgi:hypothetical protein